LGVAEAGVLGAGLLPFGAEGGPGLRAEAGCCFTGFAGLLAAGAFLAGGLFVFSPVFLWVVCVLLLPATPLYIRYLT
jgi:hypothetical protein